MFLVMPWQQTDAAVIVTVLVPIELAAPASTVITNGGSGVRSSLIVVAQDKQQEV